MALQSDKMPLVLMQLMVIRGLQSNPLPTIDIRALAIEFDDRIIIVAFFNHELGYAFIGLLEDNFIFFEPAL